MMVPAVRAVETALGTPFRHQGRVPGEHGGIDCLGLLLLAAQAEGVPYRDVADYDADVDPQFFDLALRSQMDEIPIESARPGDVLTFAASLDGPARHFGILESGWALLDGSTFIHAANSPENPDRAFVRRETINRVRRRLLRGAWRFRRG